MFRCPTPLPPGPLAALVLALLCLSPVPAPAQTDGGQLRVFGDYEVHYSVFNSSFLGPENAARYGVVRAADRAVLNISVRSRRDGKSRPVPAQVRAIRNDLIHRRPLEFTRVQEQDAVYYLAQFLFQHRERLHFEITVEPAGGSRAYSFRFQQRLYRDRR